MAVSVRSARPSDVPVIADFNNRLASETEDKRLDGSVVAAGITALLENPDRGRFFIAETNGEVVGQLLITTEWSEWRNGVFWWIQSVYVRPEFRRSGVFSTLYDTVAALAREDPLVCGLRLYVEENNSRARTTYETLGMSRTGYEVMEVEFGQD
ncbi:MAG: GNAT family N-acetyltransferase [Gammaproteobacteria bacterium]